MREKIDTSQLFKLAVKAHQEGNTKQAELLYLNAIKNGIQVESCYSNLGVIYKKRNEVGKALTAFKTAIKTKPNFSQAYETWGTYIEK